MKITLPELSLVVLVGASGAGKSTFGARHFLPTEVISSDYCRGLVSNDTNSQEASGAAFGLLHHIVALRLRAGLLTVVDATNVQPEARAALVALARQYHCRAVAIVLDLPAEVCLARNALRPDRDFGPHVVAAHIRQLRRSVRHLKEEGFRVQFVLHGEGEIEAAQVVREPMATNKKELHGPFDIIGDVHGCGTELESLLAELGYQWVGAAGPPDAAHDALGATWRHPQGRLAVFVGDLVDRGPRVAHVLELVSGMVAAGTALCVPGNHDMKLLRHFRGKAVLPTHGMDVTLQDIAGQSAAFGPRIHAFLESLPSHMVLDGGKLVVAHAGMKEELQGRSSGEVRSFAYYGETTGETDEFGLPVRLNWAREYRGKAQVVYGHTPVPEPEWLNGTINIDTGCVFGGKLSALRYPEMVIVSTPALREYAVSARPFLSAAVSQLEGGGLSAQQEHDDTLFLEDVSGRRYIETYLDRNIRIREENSITALEVMSRFAADPRWLVYLPPTMSPCETSQRPGLLEHPDEALQYYAAAGVERVVCQEKHMGSRAVVVLCRHDDVARTRFGLPDAAPGVVLTRTGRRFFGDAPLEVELLHALRAAVTAAGLWEELASDWLCLDCELMPWSAKAQELLRRQYAPVGVAASVATADAVESLRQLRGRGVEQADLLAKLEGRQGHVADYVAAYEGYCWEVSGLADLRLAPFHLMASEGALHADKDHLWHMAMLQRLCDGGAPVLLATQSLVVELGDENSRQEAVAWWQQLTERGGEGMVVKPLDFIARGDKGLLQPAVKCRGERYLRIIYGPEHTEPANLGRLRKRGLGAKRSLALREFALGLEALHRFVRQEPLRRVHECVFGVLALESEPVDPRL